MEVILTVTLTLTVPDETMKRMGNIRIEVGEPWVAVRDATSKTAGCAELRWCGYADAVRVIGRQGI
jgi:hypothetical protein